MEIDRWYKKEKWIHLVRDIKSQIIIRHKRFKEMKDLKDQKDLKKWRNEEMKTQK